VAVVTSKRDPKRRKLWSAHVLAAACMVGALGLAACDSPYADASKKAAKEANKAARIAQSAGDMRTKPSFADAFKGKNEEEAKAIAKGIHDKIAADKLNKDGIYKNYLEQRTAAEDLKQASTLLNDALKLQDFTNPTLKSGMQEQLGATAQMQARAHLNDAELKQARLTAIAIDLQGSASSITGLGLEADSLEKKATSISSPDANAKPLNLDEAKANVAQIQGVVAGLEKQIETLKNEATEIYTKTENDFRSAEAMKGTAAIDAYKKAVEERKNADEKTAQVRNLEPTLARAKADLAHATILQKQAEVQTAAASNSAQQNSDAAKAANERAGTLRKQAADMIAAKEGLAEQYKEFSSIAADLQKDIEAAAKFAETADKAYASAIAELDLQKSQLAELQLEPTHVLMKLSESRDQRAMLTLQQAAAKQEVGRANLMGHISERFQKIANDAMAAASKAAKQAAPAGAPSDSGKKYGDVAIKAFTDAAKLASDARKLSNKEPINWLSWTIESVALHGAHTIDNDPAKLLAAQTAAATAKDLNPFLQISTLAGDATPAGAATPAP
jgi:uncharacterized protein YoxC